MGKHEVRMQNQLSGRMTEINEEHIENLAFSPETAAADLETAAQRLEEKMQSQGIPGTRARKAKEPDPKRPGIPQKLPGTPETLRYP